MRTMTGLMAVAAMLTVTGGALADDAGVKFGKSCASCHGKDAKGNEKMAKALKVDGAALNLVDAPTLGKADDALIKIVTAGVGTMPAYGKKMKAEEIKALVAYLRTLAPK